METRHTSLIDFIKFFWFLQTLQGTDFENQEDKLEQSPSWVVLVGASNLSLDNCRAWRFAEGGFGVLRLPSQVI
jgi:hypothetical protein